MKSINHSQSEKYLPGVTEITRLKTFVLILWSNAWKSAHNIATQINGSCKQDKIKILCSTPEVFLYCVLLYSCMCLQHSKLVYLDSSCS